MDQTALQQLHLKVNRSRRLEMESLLHRRYSDPAPRHLQVSHSHHQHARYSLGTSLGVTSADAAITTSRFPQPRLPLQTHPQGQPRNRARHPHKRPLHKLTVQLIQTYSDINKRYYANQARIHNMARNPNEGYTDPNFDYVPLEGELLDGCYKVLQVLGKGSFGVVIKAIDVQTDENVAIKIIKAKRSFSKQAMIEIRILEFLNSNDPQDTKNLVRLKRYFQHREHLCLVYELLSHNLFDLLRCKKFSGLDLNLVRKFGFQILVALQFLQSPRIQVIHCDLKPENILLRQANKSSLKVIDFGSSCFVNERMYSYIQSRFYRSPEVILGRSYGTPIDMWSLGCVLVELFTGNPLFNGQNEHDQICRMCDVLGIPPSYVLELSSPQKLKTMFIKVSPMQWHLVPTPDFQPTGKTLQHILNEKQTKSLFEHSHPSSSSDFARFSDLIRRMLHYDPLKRLSPLAALHHPFFQPMFDQASQTNLAQSTQPTQPSKAHKQHDLRPIGGLATTYRSNGEQS